MSNKSLPRNANGGYKVPRPGAYERENSDTFGAGTLTESQAESIVGTTPSGRSRLAYWDRQRDSFRADIDVRPIVRTGDDVRVPVYGEARLVPA